MQSQALIAPVIPENVALRCSYDTAESAWRCSYPGFWEKPSVYTIAAVGFVALGVGFLFARYEPVRRVVKEVRKAIR